jgi:hypothetical protein
MQLQNCRGTTNFTKIVSRIRARSVFLLTTTQMPSANNRRCARDRWSIAITETGYAADCDVVARLDRGADAGDLARCLRAEKVSTRQLTLAARQAFTLPALHSHRPTSLAAADETFDHHVAQVVGVAEGGDAVGDRGQALHEVDQAEVEVVFDQGEARDS